MNKKIDKEKMFYNAVAIALEGDPWRMRKIKKKCGDLFGTWKMAYESLAGYEKMLGENIIKNIKPPDPEVEWKKLQDAGVQLILSSDDDYPTLLREIHHPPLGIYVRGKLPKDDDKQPTLAIVGTRRATIEGKATTKKFARKLADAGLVIVSGLALGIDASAHEGCLEATAADGSLNSTTIAVLAGGLDDFYPSENERLGRKILEHGGAVISEYPLGEPPYGYRFLERNRIVCGLSKGVLVIECPKRSGSQATANYALQQNRDLFVVPGPITHPNFFGSHQLIRQGAELVTAPEEILEAYGLAEKEKAAREAFASTPEEKQVLATLHAAGTPLEVDKIIEMTKLEPRIVNQMLSFLLIKNLIKETETGYIIE